MSPHSVYEVVVSVECELWAMSRPLGFKMDDIHIGAARLPPEDADREALPECHLEFLQGSFSARGWSVALARQSLAFDFGHVAVESSEALASSIATRSSIFEALEVWIRLFFDPHGHFPTFGVFPLEGDMLLARTVRVLSLCR